MNLTIPQIETLRKLYSEVTYTVGDKAFDTAGNKIEYDLEAVNAKILLDQEEQITSKKAAQAKLAKLGLTADDLKALLG